MTLVGIVPDTFPALRSELAKINESVHACELVEVRIEERLVSVEKRMSALESWLHWGTTILGGLVITSGVFNFFR